MNHDEIKVSPHSIEAEEGLIACLLIDGSSMEVLSDCRALKLTAESFFKTSHQIIFKLLCKMADEELPMDEITLLDQMRKDGTEEDVGGIAAIYAIQNRVDTPSHARYFARIVIEKHMARLLIRKGREIIETAYDQSEEPQVIASKAEETFRAIADSKAGDEDTMKRADYLSGVALEAIIKRAENPDAAEEELTRTGISDLDEALGGGFRDGQLVIWAARPSVGKSAVSGNAAEFNAVEEDKAVAIFSLEMQGHEMMHRFGCSRAEVDSVKINKGLVNRAESKALHDAFTAFNGADLYIDDASALTILDIRRKCHQLNAKLARKGKRLRMVVIDYAQLVQPIDPKRSRDEQVGDTSRMAKRMAKELKLPVLLLSQLNREGEKTGAEPRLSNLRESGNLEQDADVVILMHREPASENQTDQGIKPEIDSIKQIIAKQRNGPLESVPTDFVRRYCRFQNQQHRTY